MTQGGLWGEEFSPDGPRRAPSETREAIAARKRRHVARMADIGPIPPVANPERRAAAEASLVEFGCRYCMGILLDREPSPRLVEYAERIQASIEGAGLTHVRFPRGAGKTTWIKVAIAWATATGRLRFPVVFAASQILASAILNDVWAVFESPTFAEDFPEVSFPILAGDGSPQRWLSQSVQGVPTRVRKSSALLQLPTVEGAASSGAIIRARGAGASVRGLAQGSQRPDFLLLDDIQTSRDAESPARCRKLADWITKDVMGLGGRRLLSATMTSTPIRPGDLSDQFADAGLHPEWLTVETPLVRSWPRREDLWAQYAEIQREAVLAGETDYAAATAFYRAHRAEMDEGAEILDPGAYDAKLELSAVQHVHNLLISQGRESFETEYQLKPRTEEAAVRISSRLVAERYNGLPSGVMPRQTTDAVAFIDVNAKDGISWTATAFGPGQVAAILEYGRYPGNDRRLVPESASERAVQQGVAAGIAAVLSRLCAARYAREDGGDPAQLLGVWVDIGFEQNVVLTVCEDFRRRGFQAVFGCKGSSSLRYNSAGRHVLRRRFGVDFRRTEAGRWFMSVSDIWKERVQRALLAEPLQHGSLSIYGDSAALHRAFAEEICSEVLADKVKDSRGVDWYKWNLRPGAKNHWLDTSAGTFAMASWYGLLDDGETAAAGISGALAAPITVAQAEPEPAPVPVRARIPARRGPRLVRSAAGWS